MGMLFYLPFSICLILGGIILPIRRNYVQGSMGKKVFWLFFSVVLTLAVALLEDQKMGSLYCYSSGANWISLSAGIISFLSGFSIIISDKSLGEWSRWQIMGFFGIFLGFTILSLLFGSKKLGSFYMGMGIYTLVLGAAEVGILWHRKKRLSERELNNVDLPHTRGVSCWIARLCANSWRYKSFMYKDVARTQFIGSALGLPFEMMEKN